MEKREREKERVERDKGEKRSGPGITGGKKKSNQPTIVKIKIKKKRKRRKGLFGKEEKTKKNI